MRIFYIKTSTPGTKLGCQLVIRLDSGFYLWRHVVWQIFKKLLFSAEETHRRFSEAPSLAGWTFVFACLQLQPGTSIFHPSTQTNTSCCFKGGYLVLNRAECVLGGACQRQPQLSGRFKMAELRTTVVFRERCPLRDSLAALTHVPCF